MKKKGRRVPAGLIKRILAALSSKTNELRTRIMIFFLLHRDQALLLDKFHAIVAGRRSAAAQSLGSDGDDKDSTRGGEGETFVMRMNTQQPVMDPTTTRLFSYSQQENPEDRCIDLTDTLFKESEEEMELTEKEDGTGEDCKDGRGSKSMNSTMLNILEDEYGRLEEEAGEEDIDHAADLFIERFRRQIRLQRQLSLQERQRSSTRILHQNV